MRFFIIFIILSLTIMGQDDYEKWLKSQQEKLSQYIDKEDKAFADFLKKNWVQVDVEKGTEPLLKPKPETPPELISAKEKEVTIVPVTPKPIKETKIKEPTKPPVQKEMTFTFCGAEARLCTDPGIKYPLPESINNKEIADFWEKTAALDYKSIVEKSLNEKERLKLNDWGYARFIYENCREVYSGKKNESYLLTWFLLIKSGYDVKAGYEAGEVFLLIPSPNMLYNVPFISIGNDPRKYFMIRFEPEKVAGKSIFTYKEEKISDGKPIDFSIKYLPGLSGEKEMRQYKYKYAGKEYLINISYEKLLVDYFKFHPQTDLQVYFGTELSRAGLESFVKDLREIVKEMNEVEKVSFLLTFVQFFTAYKTDREQFGREKPLFIEETLCYPYSDCEDRSALFAYLVRKITGLDVIGLEYPNHIATAVAFTGNAEGEKVEYGKRTYVICDPTYMGADVGKGMPQFAGLMPKIIEVK